MILHTLADGRDILVAGSKGGFAMAFDLDKNGAVLWKTSLTEARVGAAGLIVFGGAADNQTVYYGLNQNGAVVAAVNLARWHPQVDDNSHRRRRAASLQRTP
jgi:outer membrane protein assembly factor BamB